MFYHLNGTVAELGQKDCDVAVLVCRALVPYQNVAGLVSLALAPGEVFFFDRHFVVIQEKVFSTSAGCAWAGVLFNSERFLCVLSEKVHALSAVDSVKVNVFSLVLFYKFFECHASFLGLISKTK